MVTFSWSIVEPHHLRIEMTFLTTILIAIGEYYEIGLLFVASLILTQPSIITNRIDYERKFGIYNLDLEKGDPSKNLSVAMALNYYEGITQVDASSAVKNCTHIDFGSKKIKAPYGWCKMPVNNFL
ncbi:hypothetical protein WR25_26994 [Diploscapter pachys]|uniref:Uncharacterized protein n=1 Tax=Diploscapter pachys TaxID=2018661 RepID=A0A2A2L9K9_9BILA|nr:hypothetical protein WR25_26994 [Diploscapter pachys]